MDWDWKTPSCDIPEVEQETISTGNAMSGSISLGNQGIKGEFSIDLKLGQVVDSGSGLVDNLKVQSVSKMEMSPSGSLKRPRGIGNGIQTASCLVDGCNADLSNCKEYHRRHKVCEHHTKTPQVKIRGQKQRFCQQCSRFHSLDEFDEEKRSCRKRLDGHNRRRRKPQPEPLSHLGPRYLSFSSSQVFPMTAASNTIWSGVEKAEQHDKLHNEHSQLQHLPSKQNLFPGPSSSSNAGGWKPPSFLHMTNLSLSNQTASEASICQSVLKTVASSESDARSHQMPCDGLSTQVLHSDRALSLLSSSPTQTSGICLSHSTPMAHPLHPGLHYNSLEAMNSILIPNAGEASVHCQGMFQSGPDEPSDNEAPQTLPFYWE
ncbi:unnamed protein product [Ilex paraguariensis]|uniref:SBP-type domain-containing protein n=1 Tax=Ilex paraguariensis TaxID=185542 RepID=A0ABC8TS40_9AQUA